MSKYSLHHSDNESSENASDLRKILNKIRLMKINTEVQFGIVEEELKSLRKKDHKLKSKPNSSSTSKRINSEVRALREEGVCIDSCYQPFLRYNQRSHFHYTKPEINLCTFYGHKNVEEYIE